MMKFDNTTSKYNSDIMEINFNVFYAFMIYQTVSDLNGTFVFSMD